MSKLDFTGDRIKAVRIKRGMTQFELAEAVGYKSGKVMISYIENGKIDIPLNKLNAIAEALGTSSSYLAGYEDEQQDEDLLVHFFNNLNEKGKETALEYLRMLSSNPFYTNSEDA